MVRKNEGGWRKWVDYYSLIVFTKSDLFLLPRDNEAFYAFAGAIVFSSFDLAMSYYQVPVKPVDVENIGFITQVGLYKMIKTPFELCDKPFTYKRLIFGVLQCLINHICLAYLDDVFCVKKQSNYIANLRAVCKNIGFA